MEHDRIDPNEFVNLLTVEAWLCGRAAGVHYARDNNPSDTDFIYIESDDLKDAIEEDLAHMDPEDREKVQDAFIAGWFEASEEVWRDEWDNSHE